MPNVLRHALKLHRMTKPLLLLVVKINMKRKGWIAGAVIASVVIGWWVYACGSPDREVAGFVDEKAGALSDAQVVAELTRRVPPGSTQTATMSYLYRHGLKWNQVMSLQRQPPNGQIFVRIRDGRYIPNPLAGANEYFMMIYLDGNGNVARFTLSHRPDRWGMDSGS